MAEPVLDAYPVTNVYTEHMYKIRVTHGAGTVSTIRANQVTVTRPTSTTLVVTFPKSYNEISDLNQGWAKPTGADPLAYEITSNLIDTTGVVTLTCKSTNSAGVATAPAVGDVVYLTFGVSCDELNNRGVVTTP